MHKLNKSQLKNPATERLYQVKVPIIGLTGSIATGKSTVAKYLTSKGVPLIDADSLVKDIYASDESLLFVKSICPESIVSNKIDFKLLREKFFNTPQLKTRIEEFIYSRLPEQFTKVLNDLNFSEYDFLVYDVPLLFEKNIHQHVDLTAVCYTPEKIQLERLMNRDSLGAEQAKTIIQSQISIEDKKQLADFVIDNSHDISHLEMQINKFLSKILD